MNVRSLPRHSLHFRQRITSGSMGQKAAALVLQALAAFSLIVVMVTETFAASVPGDLTATSGRAERGAAAVNGTRSPATSDRIATVETDPQHGAGSPATNIAQFSPGNAADDDGDDELANPGDIEACMPRLAHDAQDTRGRVPSHICASLIRPSRGHAHGMEHPPRR